MEEYNLINDYEILKNDYSCLINPNNEVIGYIDSFISIPNGGVRVKINNQNVLLKKAKVRKNDDRGRSYRPVVSVYEDEMNSCGIKKVYKNKNGEYYYSIEKETDTYICSFHELQWQYLDTEKEQLEKTSTEVLVKNLKVWAYSDYYNDVFLNTIDKVEDNKIYTKEFKSGYILRSNIFLTKDLAYNFKTEYREGKLNYLKEDFNWLRRINSYLEGIKLSTIEKDLIGNIISEFLQENRNNKNTI